MRILRIRTEERASYQERLAALEKLASYPLGEDSFRLDHGKDYFAFFDRMGEVLYAACVEGDRLAAVACGMLRRVPFRKGERPRRAWYLADLKAHPDFRGQRLALRMLARFFLWNYLRAPRGYAISMDPAGGKPNRVARLVAQWRWSPIRPAGRLLLWSMDAAEAERARPAIERHRGPLTFRSLEGVKDLTLESTGRRMPLLHAEWPRGLAAPAVADPAREGAVVDAARAGHVHMVCSPEGDPLAKDLASLGLAPGATATILAHRMHDCDWRFILTSEI